MNLSPKLFRVISETCGLNDRERMDAYNGFIDLYEKSKKLQSTGTKNIYALISAALAEIEHHGLPPKVMSGVELTRFEGLLPEVSYDN